MTQTEVIIGLLFLFTVIVMFADTNHKHSEIEERQLQARDKYWKAYIRNETKRITKQKRN